MLSVEDIHTYYGESYVLHGVSLEVPDNQLVALMGRNGVGKTTTVRSIMGLTPPRRGSIKLMDEELAGLQPHQIARKGIGLVPQGRRIFGSVTVGEHLEKVVARVQGREETWTIDRILEIFPRLGERWNEKAKNLSGGEQSMLAIARALRLEPSLLVMDEPMEGLSPVYVEIVIDVIRKLRDAGGVSILLVVPELEIALDLADSICVMGTGSVVFKGTPDELRERTDIQARYIGIEQ
jgi:branched-chain amino acid transport system ATP-binding protein